MLSKQEKLEKQIQSLQTQLQSYPAGKLICTKNGGRYKWYQSDGRNKIYIPKEKRDFAEQLAVKKYLSLLLEDLTSEKKAIECYLKHHNSDIGKAEQLLIDTSEYRNLLTTHFTPKSQQLNEWRNLPYKHNTNYPERLIYKSSSGHHLRSKSEVIIDMLLHKNQIPFRYECALELNGTTIYPDFTIRHPKTGEFIYWEHFGLMDNSNYSKNVCSKLQLYISNGIIPSINLITTYETQDHPLQGELVEKIICHYFQH